MTKSINYKLLLIILIKIYGLFFSIKIFGHFTPLVDANLYIDEFFQNSGHLRTQIVQKLVIILKYFNFNELLIHSFFSLISIFGFLYGLKNRQINFIIILTLMFPSVLVWTSIVGKEALFYSSFTMCLFIWTKINFKKIEKIDTILISIALIFCFILRPHYSIILLWLFFSLFIFKKYQKYKNFILIPFFIFISFVCLKFFYSDKILFDALGIIDYYARSSRFIDLNIFNPNLATLSGSYDSTLGKIIIDQYKDAILKNWIFSIIGPMPHEIINRVVFIPFFLEGLTTLFFPLIIYLIAIKDKKVNLKLLYQNYIYFLLPVLILIIIIHIPFGILNPGTAIRWRVNFDTVFYLLPLLIYFNCKIEIGKH